MSNPTAKMENGKIVVYNSYAIKDAIKVIPGRKFDGDRRVWILPATIGTVDILKTMIPSAWLDPEIKKLYDKDKDVLAEVQSTKFADHVEPLAPMPVKLGEGKSPYQHQIKGYNMALKVFGY